MSSPVALLRIGTNHIKLCSKFVFHCDEQNLSSWYERICILVETVLSVPLGRVSVNSFESEFGNLASKKSYSFMRFPKEIFSH
jgi:hypothetical protein